ncbi:MAG: AAA family ATPase [bacterium]|nr:AAA family ATPase [bacterium]
MLTKVEIHNCKSIIDASINLAPLTLFIGANGSGKTNFLQMLRQASMLEPSDPASIEKHINYQHISRLPRLLNHQVIYDSIVKGVAEGVFVAYYARPDGSQMIFWRKPLNIEDAYKLDVEIAPLHTAELAELAADALLSTKA